MLRPVTVDVSQMQELPVWSLRKQCFRDKSLVWHGSANCSYKHADRLLKYAPHGAGTQVSAISLLQGCLLNQLEGQIVEPVLKDECDQEILLTSIGPQGLICLISGSLSI